MIWNRLIYMQAEQVYIVKKIHDIAFNNILLSASQSWINQSHDTHL